MKQIKEYLESFIVAQEIRGAYNFGIQYIESREDRYEVLVLEKYFFKNLIVIIFNIDKKYYRISGNDDKLDDYKSLCVVDESIALSIVQEMLEIIIEEEFKND